MKMMCASAAVQLFVCTLGIGAARAQTPQAAWTKWARRDTNRFSGWAPMPARPVYREIVPTGQTQAGINWKYVLNAPAGNWFATDYDDSVWQNGEAGLGTTGTPRIVIRTPWTSRGIWMRRTFTFNGTPPKAAQIYGRHDDDDEVYLNGQLVGRIDGYNASYGALLPIPAGLLKSGENVLAVHCHQDAGGQGTDVGISQQVN